MEKQVHLCEECYNVGKEIVCDSLCYYCGKDICKNCERKIEIEFKKQEKYGFSGFRTFNIAPLCESCCNKFSCLDKELYQKLVNICGRAFHVEATKDETIKHHKIKSAGSGEQSGSKSK